MMRSSSMNRLGKRLRSIRLSTVAATAISAAGAFACSSEAQLAIVTDEPPEGLQWENGSPSFLSEVKEVGPYTGDDPNILWAQEHLPTGSALHSEVILRSCGPLGGVCHNRKEYPALYSAATFLSSIGAPCNVQPGTVEAVFDRCERSGDRFVLGDGAEKEIGWVEVVPIEGDDDDVEPGETMPGLHLHLADPVDFDSGDRATGNFLRSFVTSGKVEELNYATYDSRWHVFDGGRHVVAEMRNYQVDDVSELVEVGIEQGDLNRNGVFGARPDKDGVATGPVQMIVPGDPESSYLVARMRGHMEGVTVPGTRMPLANQPLNVPEMLALFCFIEGIPKDGQVNLGSDIDYENCSYKDPSTHEALAVEGAGTSWSERISPLLEANCGGCHAEDRANGDLVLVGEGVFEMLTTTRSPVDAEGRLFVSPGYPQESYLLLKLIADPSITGLGMPIDPLDGVRTLTDEELADIESWISDGAPL
jgi:hypothetical protein